MNFGIFNGRKIKINNSRFLKIRGKILQLDWIFPSLCAKFQLQIIFFEGFRGGGQLGPSSVSTRTRPVGAGASSRARPGVPAPRAGQARQPPARARRASPPRGPGAPAPRARQPPSRARRASPRAGQAWGARLEAGASARAGQAWARAWRLGRAPARGHGSPGDSPSCQPDAPRAAGELLWSPHVAMITGSFRNPIRPVKSIIFLCAFPQNLGSFRAGSYFI